MITGICNRCIAILKNVYEAVLKFHIGIKNSGITQALRRQPIPEAQQAINRGVNDRIKIKNFKEIGFHTKSNIMRLKDSSKRSSSSSFAFASGSSNQG